MSDEPPDSTDLGKRGLVASLRAFVVSRPHLVPAAFAAVMLLAALGRWPYGYYQLLRWVVCGVAVFTAFTSYTFDRPWGAWLFGFTAALFNPVAPIHLARDVWRIIDVLTAVLFVLSVAVISDRRGAQGNGVSGKRP